MSQELMVKSPFLPVIAAGPGGDLRYPPSLRFTYSRKHMICHLLFVYCTHAMQYPNLGITRLTTGILKWSEMPHCATNRLVLQSNTNKYQDLLISSRLGWGFNTVPYCWIRIVHIEDHHSTLISLLYNVQTIILVPGHHKGTMMLTPLPITTGASLPELGFSGCLNWAFIRDETLEIVEG